MHIRVIKALHCIFSFFCMSIVCASIMTTKIFLGLCFYSRYILPEQISFLYIAYKRQKYVIIKQNLTYTVPQHNIMGFHLISTRNVI